VQVIGTAGHVDHGKSTLITRLTGINPDRLKQERDREMSIELGFAWLQLPNGEEIGIVDVPGHRDFIENMLAGIGGIDAALFVVAASEGVMPQTIEHLAILDLLQIPAGVVALTKIDLVPDLEWFDLVKTELRETLADTVLAEAPIIPVSARTNEGIDDLIQAIQDTLTKRPHRPDIGRPRLPIDRTFTLPGFGTIVTGTLSNGQLSVGDPITILPQGINGRIRGLQTHKQSEEIAQPGSRTAVNISGVSVDQINRGNVLVHPDTYHPTKMLDVHCKLLPDAGSPLKHNTEVKFFLGSAEIMGRVRLLGVEELVPGESAFIQVMLQEPVAALRGDRFIIRRPSPPATIGGGQIVDPNPSRRHKRFNQQRIGELEQLLGGTPDEILLQAAQSAFTISVANLIEVSGFEHQTAKESIHQLLGQGKLIALKGNQLLIAADIFSALESRIVADLAAYHEKHPLYIGMPREQLKSQTNLEINVFDAVIKYMIEKDIIQSAGPILKLTRHRISYTPNQQAKIDSLLGKFDEQPYTPPSVKMSEERVGEDVLNSLIQTGQLVKLREDVLFKPEVYHEMKEAVIEHIRSHGSITLAELRDHFNTSRKYAVALLEHLDAIGITVRSDDKRKLRKSS